MSSDNGQVSPAASKRRIVNRTVEGAVPTRGAISRVGIPADFNLITSRLRQLRAGSQLKRITSSNHLRTSVTIFCFGKISHKCRLTKINLGARLAGLSAPAMRIQTPNLNQSPNFSFAYSEPSQAERAIRSSGSSLRFIAPAD
jgi:hypothetical protein